MKPPPGELTPKERLFVSELLVDLNGTAAAARAGYKGTRATLCDTAYRLQRKPEIARAIREGMDARAERVEVHADEVLQVLMDALRSDVGDMFDDDGVPLPLEKMPAHVRRQIQSIEVEELFEGYGEEREQKGRMHKVRLWSKDKALELALRHRGLLNDKLKLTGKTLEELIEEAVRPIPAEETTK